MSLANILGVRSNTMTSGESTFKGGCSICCQLGPSKAKKANRTAMVRIILGNADS